MAEYISEKNNDRIRRIICVIIGICTACAGTGILVRERAGLVEAKTREVQEKLAGEVFRFHVLADSDSEADQQVKLHVRDAVLSYMEEEMGEAAGEKASVKETKMWVESHISEIEEIADRTLTEEGFSYRAEARVEKCYFPEKRYGDITFPAGNYEALRIELGEAEGHNWWCVLYPNLCFIDKTCAVVSDEGKEELRGVLEEEEYHMITAADDFKIKWFFFGDEEKEKQER